MPNVVCVDDHTLIREGLKTLLDQIEDFQWQGEFLHPDALALALSHPHQIEIILIDVFYQRVNMLDTIGLLARRYPLLKWIILSAYESPSMVQHAFSYGIAAYLRKDVTLEELRKALALVWQGQKNINLTGIDSSVSFQPVKNGEPLSSREKEIITLIMHGKIEQQIAETLFISKHTVHSHRKNIFRKIGLHSNAELIRYFIENPLY